MAGHEILALVTQVRPLLPEPSINQREVQRRRGWVSEGVLLRPLCRPDTAASYNRITQTVNIDGQPGGKLYRDQAAPSDGSGQPCSGCPSLFIGVTQERIVSDESFKRSFRNMGLQRGEWEESKMTKKADDAAAEEREGYRRWYENKYPDRAEAARLRDENKRLRAALEQISSVESITFDKYAYRRIAQSALGISPTEPPLTPGRTEDLAHGGWKPPDPYRPD